jgi:uncharacterized membrane protein YkoI
MIQTRRPADRDLRTFRRAAATLGLAATLLLPGTAPAADAEAPVQGAAAEPSAKISREQAVKAALAAVPGKVTDTGIEKKRGKNVWVIEIVADKDGAEIDVLVDLDSGKVIGTDR